MQIERVEAFREWLATSPVGKFYIYHTGFLAIDRVKVIVDEKGDIVYSPVPEIHELAKLAIDAFEDNTVHLFQRKIHDNEYQYIAVKRYKLGKSRRREWR